MDTFSYSISSYFLIIIIQHDLLHPIVWTCALPAIIHNAGSSMCDRAPVQAKIGLQVGKKYFLS